MTAPPLPCQWDGEAFRPLPRFARIADKHYVVGETYSLVTHEERSEASHRHYYAALHEVWQNLPDPWATMFPTSEHMRKHALIKAGYCDQRSIACASKAEAQRVAGFIRPMDEYAVVIASEAVVTVYTAKSQSYRAMGRKDFYASKEAVLGWCASLIGTTADELQRAGEAA
jgi:hypothetical protein